MKATIDIGKDNLSSCKITIGRKVIKWEDLNRYEQIQMLNTLAEFHLLYKNFLKEE